MGLEAPSDEPAIETLMIYLIVTTLLLALMVVYFYYYAGLINHFLSIIIFLIPPMIANGAAVITKKFKGFLHGGKVTLTPIDGGRTWKGKRLLGDHKTYDGFFFGSLSGVVVGEAVALIAYLLGWRDSILLAVTAPYTSIAALTGDLISSFLKRRIGLKPGAPLPLIDQLTFYLLAVIVLLAIGFQVTLQDVVVVALLVYSLHVMTNCLAKMGGLKEECP